MDFGNTDFLNPLFLLGSIRPEYFRPRLEFASITELDVEKLKSLGVRALVFDVDNTICRYHGIEVDGRIRESFERITRKFPSCILSNTSGERANKLEGYFGLHAVKPDEMKPRPGAFREVVEYLAVKPSEVAVVGDRIMTDVVGANKAGCVSVKVKPLDPSSEPFPLKLSRAFENALAFTYKKLGL